MGHVRDLPGSKLGIDLEKNFALTYVVADKKEQKVKELKQAAAKASAVILATDPDREGEAIAWHVASLLRGEVKGEKLKVKSENADGLKRIVFHEITESAIKEALLHPRSLDMNLVDAQQARRVLDRLVGYKLSPLLWRKVRRGLSAGRVQSVAVRLIVEREKEIEAFSAMEYWEIIAKLKVRSTRLEVENTDFEAKLIKFGDQPIEIKTEQEAKTHLALLEKAAYEVSNVVTKEVRRNPYPPFTTSTLQQAASNLFGWSAKRTMQVAQNLYEEGLITYHRTDSTNLAMEAVSGIRSFISVEFGANYLPDKPKFYVTKSKVAQEAHEAIRPTNVSEKLKVKSEKSNRDEERLYELIWKRFVSCQMREAVYEQTSVDVKGERRNENGESTTYIFRATGSRQVFDGWQRVMSNEKLAMSNEDESKQLPQLAQFDKLDLLKLTPSQHFTEPPPRYTEASLIKTLEEYGIGRPSTYAPIISTIQERQYVEKIEKKFKPSALGFAVNDFLMANFSNILDYKFTARMEDELDNVANGEKQWVPVIKEFYAPFAEQLEKVGETAERVKVEVEETDEICPEDGGKLVIRIGKFGKFVACSNFPKCKFTKQFTQKADVLCPKCGGEVIIKRTKNKKTFFGCSNYPNCDFASWTKPKPAEPVGQAAST